MTAKDTDSWNQWREHVLEEIRAIRDDVTDLKVELASLKVKASIWGGLAGMLPLIIEKALGR